MSPYAIFPRDGNFCVYKVDADNRPVDKALGTHKSKERASAQLRALYANEKVNRAMQNLRDVVERRGKYGRPGQVGGSRSDPSQEAANPMANSGTPTSTKPKNTNVTQLKDHITKKGLGSAIQELGGNWLADVATKDKPSYFGGTGDWSYFFNNMSVKDNPNAPLMAFKDTETGKVSVGHIRQVMNTGLGSMGLFLDTGESLNFKPHENTIDVGIFGELPKGWDPKLAFRPKDTTDYSGMTQAMARK